MANRTKLIGLALLLCAGASFSQAVFKWTDENGEVHYGESVPPGIENFERLEIAQSPTPPRQPAQATERAAPETAATSRSAPRVADLPPVETMSQAELDRRCEVAREREIAPLREAAIAECQENRRSDPAFCERFYADFGDAGVTTTGAVRPRMFNDLPECLEADEARRNRPRR